ncbi:MAG: ATP-binding protein [Betaproteobacteria bacterium]|jgi:two-component system OmpR family sensor kinase/two-component system sensor histidine kinase QseC|nr:ATP-binding protein [Betaproteobacteria bacterium]
MHSIQARVLWSSFALVTLTALVLGAATYLGVLRETETLFDYQLKQMALSLRDQSVGAPVEQALPPPEPTDFVVNVWNSDGQAVYHSRYVPGMPSSVSLGFSTVQIAGDEWRMFSLGFGNRVIRVAQPMAVRRHLAAEAALRSVMPLLAVAPLLALAVWWVVGFSLGPLRRVANEVKGLQAQALSPLDARGLPTEIEPLVASLNALLGRLRGAFDKQQAFVADAAHELRSPLTALKLQLEVLRRSTEPDARHEATDRLAAGIERARHLVEQLLTLARSEPRDASGAGGAAADAPVRIELCEAVRGAIVDTVALAAERGIDLSLEQGSEDGSAPVGAGAVSVLSPDPRSLSALVRNLVDNAVRYGRADGQVRVRVEATAAGARLTVDDDGPGIPAEERERVFDRFYRRHPGETTGSGLGLAIVRAIADRHGASIVLGEAPIGGLRVQVGFPTGGEAA